MVNKLSYRFLLAIVSVVMVALCATVQSCIRPERSTSTTTVSYKDSLVKIPGEVVKADISDYDSLLKVLQSLKDQGKPAEIIYRNTPESKTFLTLKMDDQGKVQAECETNEAILKLLNKIIETKTENTHIVNQVPRWVWLTLGVLLLLMLLVFGFIVLLIIIKLIR